LRFLLRTIEFQLAVHRRLLRHTKFGSFISWILLTYWFGDSFVAVARFAGNVIWLASMNFCVFHTAVIRAALHSSLRFLQRGTLVRSRCVQIFTHSIFLQLHASFIDRMTLYLARFSHIWRTKGTLLLMVTKIRCHNLLFGLSIFINFICIYCILLGHFSRQFCALSCLG